jgi:hypothetical protein
MKYILEAKAVIRTVQANQRVRGPDFDLLPPLRDCRFENEACSRRYWKIYRDGKVRDASAHLDFPHTNE